MVGTFRQSGIGQLLVGAIVAAIIVVFVFTGIKGGGATNGCAIEVGEHCVDAKEYNAAYGLVTAIGLRENAAKRLKLPEQVARGLAERELLLDEAERLGISTSDEDVDDELAEGRTQVSLPADGAERLALSLALCVDGPRGCAPGTIGLRALPVKRDGKLDFERYKRMVRVVTGRSPGNFKEMQQREMTAERVRNAIRTQVRVSPEETFLAYERARSKVTARLVRLDPAWFARYGAPLSAAEVDDWAAGHAKEVDEAFAKVKDQYTEGCPVISEIRVDVSPASSDDDKALDRKKVDEAVKRLKAREDFTVIAREVSDAPEAEFGGRVGCLNDSAYGPGAQELLKGIADLEPGATSEVIETVRGLHVVRLEKKLQKDELEAEARRQVALELATEARANEAAKKLAEQLIEMAKGGASLDEAAEELATKYAEAGPVPGPKGEDESHSAMNSDARPRVEISRPFTIEQDPLRDARPKENVAVLAFSLEKEDEIAEKPVELESGYAVVQLKSRDMATRESFEEERLDLMEQLRARKAEAALIDYVERLRRRAGAVQFNPRFVPTGDSKTEEDKPAEKS